MGFIEFKCETKEEFGLKYVHEKGVSIGVCFHF